MPFDETGRRPGRRPSRNVLGGVLGLCSSEPMTGFLRNGCCETTPEDVGSHTVCAVMTAEFLAFSKASGNDLRRRGRNSALPGCGRAIAGACAHRAGRRRWRLTRHPKWCCAQPRKARCGTARWPI